ncbi:signal transduction histidine kinase [Kineosphaera limosa]|uniref:Putative two-component histidine kinase n=1 Tax=Kineosphaera limosa NBRC 100340 TaxID=1184609 RepID=K6WDL1_9MICO|nr:PspC domain-containing protein [Kineosphaera limosa]NYE01804.1 signal transduction histidine kinase [Kineosphaera limosa]GAB97355.1 putative two-component histidine kinase [Kineosphaera limosa NBRC 100340]
MSTPQGPTRAGRLVRTRSGAVVAGVAGGLAAHTGLDVRVVRVLFVVLNLFFGLGFLAYLLLWATLPATDAGQGSSGRRLPVQLLLLGAALLALGALGATGGSWLPDFVRPALPVLAVAVGAVIAWSDVEAFERQGWLGPTGGRRALPRVLAGAALSAVGIVVLLTSGQGLSMAVDVGVATIAVLAGIGLVLAPWVAGFWRRYEREQTARIRETERADIAAHLHDSVLQTLALIQRADDAGIAARLARGQERELREWLYGGAPTAGSLAAEISRLAVEVEEQHEVPIDVVVTGDRSVDDAGEVLLGALREALLNAVRHGRPPVSVYVEIGRAEAEAFVRDHGDGFDLDQLDEVPPDRLGVRESILGRMQRHGGRARWRRLEEGTEVALTVPLETAQPPAAALPPTPAQLPAEGRVEPAPAPSELAVRSEPAAPPALSQPSAATREETT